MEILTVKDLSFTYPESRESTVDRLSLTLDAGDFFVLFGPSGCGKTTLLRTLKPQLTPHGTLRGEILFRGAPLGGLDLRDAAAKIGFVMQSPDSQIVTDKVWHELAFGLESLGYDTPTIRRRVAEMASFFGIQNWFHRNVSSLSGGQKQILNLASVMVMQPELLLLDEPTSRLDPIAASDFLAVLKKINREFGTTVLLTEHRLEEALPLSTKTAVMEKGRLLCTGSVTEVGDFLRSRRHPLFAAMPAAARIWGSVSSSLPCPISVNEGRAFLSTYQETHEIAPVREEEQKPPPGGVRIEVTDAWFRYDKDAPDVVKNASLTACGGELFCLLGGNGAGKTTLLKLIAGIKRPYRGEVKTEGRVALLPQEPGALFLKKTVREDLEDAASDHAPREEQARRIAEVLSLCRLSELAERHPFDLSGGEQQRAALAVLLLTAPDILLLDEPTKGFDAAFKAEFAAILRRLTDAGVCIVMVSHDIEFCAENAHRCALFFDGGILAQDGPRRFFAGNGFYTTSANRIARDILPDAVTVKEVIDAIGGTSETPPQTAPESPQAERPGSGDDESAGKSDQVKKSDQAEKVDRSEKTDQAKKADQTGETGQAREPDPSKGANNAKSPEKSRKKLPLWRKLGAWITGLLAFLTLVYALSTEKLGEMLGAGGITGAGREQLILYGAITVFLLLTALFSARRADPPVDVQTPKEKRRLSKRTRAAVVLILLLIPLTLFAGLVFLERKQYYLTALAVLMECMLPFFLVFEGRKPKARELVIISVLCAIGIAGRAAFFMLPQFKPVLALTIVAGVAFGGETGFLVGAVTMLVSNMLFSEGPWTPWQMFAAGIVGFLSGILYRKGLLRRTRASLCIFGALCALLIYGGIMNPASALLWGSESLNFKILLTYFLTGFPMDCVHAAATALFLWFLAEPMLEKLDRVKRKYGLVE